LGPDGSNTGLFGTSTNHDIRFMNNNTERVRIDTSGRLLVGTSTSPGGGEGQYAKFVVQASTGGAANGGYISLQKGSPATDGFAAGNTMGLINFGDSAGYTFAKIECQNDATTGANDYPGRLVFSTTADGAASPTERFRIGSAGQLGIGGATYGTSGQVLTSGGASAAPSWASAAGGITSGTAVASTSGTAIDFTGIPSWVKRVTVMFSGVSLAAYNSELNSIMVKIGTSSGIESTSYVQVGSNTSGVANFSRTDGFHIAVWGSAASSIQGIMQISNLSGNAWCCSSTVGSTLGYTASTGGTKTLSGALDRVRITTPGGTDTFDAGSINIQYQS
jgi:hypothetical protein